MERWKPVVGHEGVYEVSDLGRVRILVRRHNIHPGTMLRLRPDRNGYLLVRLSRDGSQEAGSDHRVHRLVAEAFIEPIPDGLQVNHLNGVKDDNRAANLEIVSCRENIRHAIDVLGARRGERNHAAKLTEPDVLAIRERAATGEPFGRIARDFGISQVAASHIARGKAWAHVGGPRTKARHGAGRPKGG